MKIICSILILLMPCMAAAGDLDIAWDKCVLYWYHDNVSTNLPALNDIVHMSMAGGVQSFDWQITNTPPSKATLEASEAAALAWWADYNKTQEADFDKWDERTKALAKLCRKEINKIRKAHSLPEYTVAKWKAMLKAEL